MSCAHLQLREHACYYAPMSQLCDTHTDTAMSGIPPTSAPMIPSPLMGEVAAKRRVRACPESLEGVTARRLDKTRTFLGHFGDIFARARYGGRVVAVSPAGASQVCDVPKCPQMSQKIDPLTSPLMGEVAAKRRVRVPLWTGENQGEGGAGSPHLSLDGRGRREAAGEGVPGALTDRDLGEM